VKGIARYLVLGLILVSSAIYSQGTITPSQILSLADTLYDAQLTNNQLIDLVKKSQDEISLLEKVEFRSETDEWDLERQEYTVRTSFKSRNERRAERLVMESMLYDADLYLIEERAKNMEDILNDLIDLKYKKDRLEILSEIIKIIDDKDKLLKADLIRNDKVDVLGVIKLDDEKLKLRREIDDIKRDVGDLQRRLKPDGKRDWQIDFSEWISISELNAKVYEIKSGKSNPLELLKKSIQIKERSASLKKEIAEGDRVLDFIQIKHAGRENSNFGEELSIGFSLIFPTGHVNRTSILEAKIELAKEEWEYANIESVLTKERKQVIIDYENSNQSLKEYISLIESQDLNIKLNNLAANSAEPNILIEIKEIILNRKMEVKRLEKEVYERYVDVLETYGKLLEEKPQLYLENNY